MFASQTHQDVKIITLDGIINALTIPQLPDNICQSDCKNFIIDLYDVSVLDSAGIAWMVNLLKTARKRGGKAVIVWSKSDVANRIIQITQFDKIFTMTHDVRTAIHLI